MPTENALLNPLATRDLVSTLSSNQSASSRALVRRLAREINRIANMIKDDGYDSDQCSDSLKLNGLGSINLDIEIPNPLTDVAHVSLNGLTGGVSGLRSLQDDLANFHQILGESVDSLWLQILNAGITSIPPEILSEIFQHACSPDPEGIRLAFTLSQVCKRFRATALHTPAIWATITNDLPSEWVKLCLARSVSSPLTILVNDKPIEEEDINALQEFSNFVLLITSVRDRWQSFKYFEFGERVTWKQLRLLRSSTSGMSFPALRDLSVSTPYAAFYPEKIGEMFFSSWTCPRLTSFYGKGVQPNLSLPNSLIVCALHVRNDYAYSFEETKFNYRGLPEHLASFKNLKKLDFLLEIAEWWEEPQRNFIDCFSMIALEELHIIYKRTPNTSFGTPNSNQGFNSIHLIKSIFVHMELPALKSLTCELVIEGNIFRNIREVLPVASRCPNLRQLTLKHRLYKYSYYSNNKELSEYVTAGPTGFQALFPLFPQIHHLELDGPGLCRFSHEMPVNESFPPLRTITLRGCSDEQFVIDLVHLLRRGPHWHLFETLELDTCVGFANPHSYESIRALLDDDLGIRKLVVDRNMIE